MTARQSHQDAILTGEEITVIRDALAACSRVLGWAAQHDGTELRAVVAGATAAAGVSRSPSGLAYYVSLAIDYLDLAPAARRTQ